MGSMSKSRIPQVIVKTLKSEMFRNTVLVSVGKNHLLMAAVQSLIILFRNENLTRKLGLTSLKTAKRQVSRFLIYELVTTTTSELLLAMNLVKVKSLKCYNQQDQVLL